MNDVDLKPVIEQPVRGLQPQYPPPITTPVPASAAVSAIRSQSSSVRKTNTPSLSSPSLPTAPDIGGTKA